MPAIRRSPDRKQLDQNSSLILPKSDPRKGYPILKRIAACESTGDPDAEPEQFNADGTVLRGRANSADIREFQINWDFWGAKAEELQFDLFTNAAMANGIMDVYPIRKRSLVFNEACWRE